MNKVCREEKGNIWLSRGQSVRVRRCNLFMVYHHCKNTREEEKGELNSQDSQIAKDEKRTERGKRKHYIISKRRFFHSL